MTTAEATLPLLEEVLSVATRQVETGRVRVATRTEVVNELVSATLQTSVVEITRVPVGKEVAEMPGVTTLGDLTVIPVVEEILVVEKRLYLKEELHVRRQTTEERTEATIPLRKQRADISRSPGQPHDHEENHDG